MTKTEEIERFREIVASLPKGSYLHGLLSGTEDFVADMIRNDIAHPSFTIANWRRDFELRDQIKDLEARAVDLNNELAQLNASYRSAQGLYERLRAEAKSCGERMQRI